MPDTTKKPNSYNQLLERNIILKMKLLKLVCYGNLLLLAFTLCIFRYGFLEQQPDLPLALNELQFLLFVISCVSIAAGGFLINNIADIDGKENVKSIFGINEDNAYYLYAALNITGVGIGFYLSNLIGKPGFSLVFILIAGTLYLYSSSLKYTLIANNLIISVIASLSLLLLGIFNLYPVITTANQPYLSTVFEVLLDYTIFTFLITFIREIVKNLRDVDHDYNVGISTLPIALGKDRTAKVVFFLMLVPVALLLYYANKYILNLTWALIYGLIFILGPSIYFLIKIWTAKTAKEFNLLSLVLKIVMAFAALSIVVITFNIKYNA